MLATLAFFAMTSAFARSEVIAKARYQDDAYKIYAELYFDKEKKRADLWVEWDQPKTNGAEAVAFKATSLDERLKDAGFALKSAPAAHLEGETILIFNGFDRASGAWNANRGFSLLSRVPADYLPDRTLDFVRKNFPAALVSDATGAPKYVKTLLLRATDSQVYPVAAFDAELTLPKAK